MKEAIHLWIGAVCMVAGACAQSTRQQEVFLRCEYIDTKLSIKFDHVYALDVYRSHG